MASHHKPQDINELADALREEWRRIPQATIWAAHEEHEASLSRVPGGEWRPFSLFCESYVLTVTKFEFKFKSGDSLNALLLMITALSNYHFNAVMH